MLPCASLIRVMLPLPRAEAIRILRPAPGEDLATSLEVKSQLAYQVKMKLDDQQPTAAVDLDGTLTIPHPHWPKVAIDEVEVRPGAAEGMQQLQAAGWRLIIFTMHDDLDGVADWLDDHDIPYHFINENPDQDSDSPKVQAHLYIDDRALNADKPWPKIVQEVLDSGDAPEPKSKHLIVTGHSGSGKSTLAKVLGERLSLPVHKVDMDPLWQENRELADHPDRYTAGTKVAKQFRKLLKKLVRRAVSKEEPHILEGCQFLAATGTLRGHKVLVIGGDEDDITQQRLRRDFEDGKLQRDGTDKRIQKAVDLYKKLQPDVKRLQSRSGVESIAPHESEEWARNYVFEQTVHALTQAGEDIEVAKTHAAELANFQLYDHKKDGEELTSPSSPTTPYLTEPNHTKPHHASPHLTEPHHTGPDRTAGVVNFRKRLAAVQQNLEEKALSAMSETSGGALVAPPQQGGFHARRKCLKCGRYLVQSKMGWGCPDPSCNWSLFAASAETVKAFRYRRKAWITVGGHPCEDGEGQHCEGTRVEVEGGTVRKGPKRLRGRQLDRPKPPAVQPSRVQSDQRQPAQPPSARGKAEAPTKAEPPPARKPFEFKAKESKAKVRVQGDLATDKLALDPSDYASMVGAPDDAKVRVEDVSNLLGEQAIAISVDHPHYNMERYLLLDDAGKLYVKNENFFIRAGHQKSGLGREVFMNQVAWAKENGIAYIKCEAARGEGMNGYYTWPRFGYDAPIANIEDPAIRDEIKERYPQAKTVLDVMDEPGGREWWKANGGWIIDAKFDLKPGSRSLEVLEDYLTERQGG